LRSFGQTDATNLPATRCMWGNGNDNGIFSNMVGFGKYSYKSANGVLNHFFLTGFANRKADITIYIMSGFDDVPQLMAKLGKYKNSKGCLYVKHLADIDQHVLSELITHSIAVMLARHP
jgi:Domain of unknown function (DU1801)